MGLAQRHSPCAEASPLATRPNGCSGATSLVMFPHSREWLWGEQLVCT